MHTHLDLGGEILFGGDERLHTPLAHRLDCHPPRLLRHPGDTRGVVVVALRTIKYHGHHVSEGRRRSAKVGEGHGGRRDGESWQTCMMMAIWRCLNALSSSSEKAFRAR